jgi:excisionase family DNA binding protein
MSQSNPAAVDPAPALLDFPAAAKYLSSTVWAIRRLVWRGELPYKQVGKRFCIPRKALDEWAAKGLRRNAA